LDIPRPNPVGRNRSQKRRDLLGLAVLFILVQIPALKVYDIKLIEGVGIAALILNLARLSTFERRLVGYFSLFFLLTLALNPFHSFPADTAGSFLKRPYVMTAARYAEYLSLVGFVWLIRNHVRRLGAVKVVQTFIATSAVVQLLILLFYLLEASNLEIIDVAYLENDFLRMKGFFVEGGPLGLFNAFLIFLTLLFWRGARKWALAVFLLIFVLLGKSKAGLTALAACACATAIIQARRLFAHRGPRLCFRLAVGIAFLAVFLLLSSVYLVDLVDRDGLQAIIDQDPDDFWISGGRIPGFFIVQQMFRAHPVLGIGMGNYQLLRNADRYRDFMPETVVWDLHGYGGLVEIVNQFGLLGLVLFLWILIPAFRPLSRHALLLAAFLIPFAFGLSLHFHYPWLIIGLLPTERRGPPAA
jgi:hypothetical protein